jgi:hypothetical protein
MMAARTRFSYAKKALCRRADPRIAGVIIATLLVSLIASCTLSAVSPPPPAKPPVEEEDSTRPAQAKKPPKVEEEEGQGRHIAELAVEAEQAARPEVKQLFAALVSPHDVVVWKDGRVTDVAPISQYIGASPGSQGTVNLRLYDRNGRATPMTACSSPSSSASIITKSAP